MRGWDGITDRRIPSRRPRLIIYSGSVTIGGSTCPIARYSGGMPIEYCNREYRRLRWITSPEADALDYAVQCDEVGMEHDLSDQGGNLAKNKGGGGVVSRSFRRQRGIFGMER
jgi:hypothetical protein